jgi:hypothetical protein
VRRSLPYLLAAAGAALAVSGCGSSGGPTVTIPAARTFKLAGFEPSGPVHTGRPTRISFTVEQPSGQPLTRYKTGSGPHTGIHLIIVRRDLSAIIHRHPPVGPDGRLTEHVTFPEPGPYRVIVDVYPDLPGGLRNFQLFHQLRVQGKVRVKPLPPFQSTVVVDGYRFTMEGRPKLRAIRPAFLKITVTDPQGHPVRFTPWFGALAHAIFFRAGNLDYFHTHVCSPGASGCTSTLAGANVTGKSSIPGRLDVGVLLPEPGTWRLFVQIRARGHVLTAPYTLEVK